MGHKSHPIGLRLGVHRKWKSNWFFESKNYAKFIHLNLNIEKFFKGFLYFYGIKTLLLKTQLIKLASNQLFIFIFYYRFRKKLKKSKYKPGLKKWKSNLEQYFSTNDVYKNFSNSEHYLIKARHADLKQLLIQENVKSFFKNFLLFKKNLSKNFLLKNTVPSISLLKNKSLINFGKNFFFSTLFLKFKFSTNFKKICLKKLKLLLNIKKNVLELLKTFFFKKYFLLKQSEIKAKILKNSFLKTSYNIFVKNYFLNLKGNLNVNLILKLYTITLLNDLWKQKKLKNFFYNTSFLKKNFLLNTHSKNIGKKKNSQKSVFSKKNVFFNISDIKKFLTKITNLKIKLIFINALSFTKFFYIISENKKKKKEKFNVFKIQKLMLSKYKYHAIFIKDFIHLTFINVLLKNPASIVNFIAEQFKRLPKNRKQLKLLTFINQSLKIFCQQRKEFSGFKFQLKGRLNRRNRTHKWNFQKGILPIQTYDTRVEYAYTEGFTRSGLIGIKLWFFYKKNFKRIFKIKLLQYLHYSKYKHILNVSNINLKIKKFKNVKTKSKKISKK